MTDVAYLDCAASTPLRPEALDAMLPYLTQHHGNPSGSHAIARRARLGLDDARDIVAELTGADAHGVVFTSGGTEADNLVVHGVVSRRGGTPVCPATEHHGVLNPVLAHSGLVVGVDSNGVIDLNHLAAELSSHDDVCIVSVMAVNNETGVVQPLAEIAKLIDTHAAGAVFHTDAVQAAHWMDLRDVFAHVDAMSLAGHKFGGPNGSGVLVLRDGVELNAQILGGGQEHDRRSGTQNVAAAVGFAEALRVTEQQRPQERLRIVGFRSELEDVLTSSPFVASTVSADIGVPGICHLTVGGVESEVLLVALEHGGVMAAAGSSCASGALQPSHVLMAMGMSREQAVGALRLSMAFSTTEAEIRLALDAIPSIISALASGEVTSR